MEKSKLFSFWICLLILVIFVGKGLAQVHGEWTLLENRFTHPEIHKAQISLINKSKTSVKAGWKLYFNTIFISIYTECLSPDITIRHLQGDFFIVEGLTPEIEAGADFPLLYQSRGPFLKNSYAPEGLILLHKDGQVEEINSYKTQEFTAGQLAEMAKGTPLPIPTSQLRFAQNEVIQQLPRASLPPFLPTPKSWSYQGSPIKVANPRITVDKSSLFPKTTAYIEERLAGWQQPDYRKKSNIHIQFTAAADLPEEGYVLEVKGRKVNIQAATEIGAFYGFQSFMALLPPTNAEYSDPQLILPQVKIHDEPAYGYRGFFLDVARNFQSKEQVKKILDLIAHYKLNVFHLNLANDEGWRIEIPGLPELTAFGSRRGFSTDESEFLWPYYASGALPDQSTTGSGYYSVDDFQEILTYAKARHIEVIPELGVPAHSRAAILAMEKRYAKLLQEGKEQEALAYRLADPNDQSIYLSAQNFRGNTVCVCQESTYAFYDKLVSEIKKMYAAAEVPLTNWHTGGDEVPRGAWKASPICAEFLKQNPTVKFEELNDYFRSRTAEILQMHGLQLGGWEEIGLVHQGNDKLPNPKFSNAQWRLYAWDAVAGWGGEDMAYQLANAGYPVVICASANFYFDLAYNWDPDERGHTWSGVVDMYQAWKTVPGKLYLSHDQTIEGKPWNWEEQARSFTPLTEEGKQNILGVSGQLWTETVKGPQMMEQYLLPKMLGYIERAWNGDPEWADGGSEEAIKTKREAAWVQFANLVGQIELPRLAQLNGGYSISVPKPGIIVRDNKVMANAPLPGMLIRYTTDGTEPHANSAQYHVPLPFEHWQQFQFKLFLPSGKSGRASGLD
jgi:hexosaminidase